MSFSEFLPSATRLGWLIYWIIFLFSFLEFSPFAGVILPGIITLIVAGFLASFRILNIWSVFIAAVLGGILGDILSYYLGARFGKKLFLETEKFFHLRYLENAEAYLKNKGINSAFFGKFIGSIRPFISFISGEKGRSSRRIIFSSLLGTFAFCSVYIFLGFLAGLVFSLLTLWIDRLTLLILVFAAVFAFIFYLWKIIVKNKLLIINFFNSFFGSLVSAIKKSKYFLRFKEKYPWLFRFIRRRLKAETYLGLHLTIGFLISAVFLWLFFSVVQDLIFKDPLYLADLRIVNLMSAFRSLRLTKLMLFITDFGEWQVISIFGLIFSFILLSCRKFRQFLILLVGLLGGTALFSIIKIISHRARPPIAGQIISTGGYSFPSGHAVMSIVFYGLIIYFLVKNAKKWESKAAFLLGGASFVLLIGISRVYLGVHYPSDVLGGYFLGLTWLTMVITAIEIQAKYFPAPKIVSRHAINKKFFYGALIVSILLSGFYLIQFYRLREMFLLPSRLESYSAKVKSALDIFSYLPKYSETLTGEPMEPISFVFVGREEEIEKAFGEIGWVKADQPTARNILKIALAVILSKGYERAPMTPAFFNYLPNDFGFEMVLNKNSVVQRHHLRLWKTSFIYQGFPIWVATASFDEGIRYFVAHNINSDIDKERNFIFENLLKTGLVKSHLQIQLVAPLSGQNQIGDKFFTDGRSFVLFFD